jgi:hypothetical protein
LAKLFEQGSPKFRKMFRSFEKVWKKPKETDKEPESFVGVKQQTLFFA